MIDVVIFQNTSQEEHKELSLKRENFRVLKPKKTEHIRRKVSGGGGGGGEKKVAPHQEPDMFQHLDEYCWHNLSFNFIFHRGRMDAYLILHYFTT